MRGGRAYNVALAVLVVGLFAENIVLVRQNRQLKSPTSFGQFAAKPGSVIASIVAVGTDSKIREIPLSESSRYFLLISFSPGCPTCRDNQAAFTRLFSIAAKSGWQPLWVSRDDLRSTAQYGLQNGIASSSLLSEPTYGTYVALHMNLVPQVIAVSPGGRIENVWTGELTPKAEANIANFMASHPAALREPHASGFGPAVDHSHDKLARKEE